MTTLPDRSKMAPVRAAPISEVADHWSIAFTTGNSSEDGEDWCIQTDHVRASELIFCEFLSDPKDDAEAIAAIVNAYREGRLVEAKTE